MIDRRGGWAALGGLVITLACAACDTATVSPTPIKITIDPMQNDTPQHTMLLFREAYQYEDNLAYAKLLTSDFRFAFSSQSDPLLAAAWGARWDKDAELVSARHIALGFTDSLGGYVPPVGSMEVGIVGDSYFADPAHPDSGDAYAFCPIAKLELKADFAAAGTRAVDAASSQAFWLVSGDAAQLVAGQPADRHHWYIAGWADLSTLADPTSPDTSYAPTTWGRWKARNHG